MHRLAERFKRRGLSLLEVLLIVVSLFARAIIFSSCMREKYKNRGYGRTRSDMRSLATAIEAYYVDNHAYPAMANKAQGINAMRVFGCASARVSAKARPGPTPALSAPLKSVGLPTRWSGCRARNQPSVPLCIMIICGLRSGSSGITPRPFMLD